MLSAKELSEAKIEEFRTFAKATTEAVADLMKETQQLVIWLVSLSSGGLLLLANKPVLLQDAPPPLSALLVTFLVATVVAGAAQRIANLAFLKAVQGHFLLLDIYLGSYLRGVRDVPPPSDAWDEAELEYRLKLHFDIDVVSHPIDELRNRYRSAYLQYAAAELMSQGEFSELVGVSKQPSAASNAPSSAVALRRRERRVHIYSRIGLVLYMVLIGLFVGAIITLGLVLGFTYLRA